MPIKFIHTSDWQIGKVFRFLDDEASGLIQAARLQAVTRLGELAVEHGAAHVLVAGDVYDSTALSIQSLNRPLERMRDQPNVQWHLLPGNHDYHRPNGFWDMLQRRGLPLNIQLHLEAKPVSIAEGVVLLPAPLQHRRAIADPTDWMDGVDRSTDAIRVGLAHGSIRGFGSEPAATPNLIDFERPTKAGLAYLALGDWHGQRRIGERCWYSGTPETDAFDVEGGGQVLLVDVAAPQAPLAVTPLACGQFRWVTHTAHLAGRDDVEALDRRLRDLGGMLDRILVRLRVEGALSLADRAFFDERIAEGVSAALCYLRVDDEKLFPQPTDEDLDRIDHGGFVRAAAEELRRQAAEGGEEERALAASALQRLYVEHKKLQGADK